MRLPRPIFCALFGLASSFVIADIEFHPHPGYSEPEYFSGTNARAFYSANVTYPDVHIEASELYLNDEPVLVKTYPILGTPTRPIYLYECQSAVMFDSNHFNHQETVTVKYRVKTGGVWYEDVYDAPAKNKAILMGLDYLEIGASIDTRGCKKAQQWLDDVGYVNKIRYDQWTPGDLAYEINEDVNYFMFAGHGSASSILTGEHLSEDPPGNWFGTAVFAESSGSLPNIYDMVVNKMGPVHPTPPYNTTARPPFNIAFLLTCDAGIGNDFMSFLYPYLNEHGGFLENQAVCGFTEKIQLDHFNFLSGKFHERLLAGYSAKNSMEYMANEARSEGYITSDGGDYDETVVRVIGDDWATLKNVYNPGQRLMSWTKEITVS